MASSKDKDSHKRRMADIDKIALPDSDSPGYERHINNLKKLSANHVGINKEISKRYWTAKTIALATINNGAGYISDQMLRQFYLEYVDRVFNVGLRMLPASFNVMEAFFDYDASLNVFRIHPEKDYLISVEDFFDFVTGEYSPKEDISAAYNLPEGVIHNYTAFDDPQSCMFTVGNNNEFGISSVSMVRRGDELSVMLVAGKSYHEAEKLEAIKLAKTVILTKPSLEKQINKVSPCNEIWDLTHTENSPGLWQHILLVRFNLKSKTHSARYLMQELSKGFLVLHDDPDLPLPNGKEPGVDELSNYSTLFDLAKTSVLIPAYINYRLIYVKNEGVKTSFGVGLIGSLKKQREAAALNSNERVVIRVISAVRVINTSRSSAIGRTYSPPDFVVNVAGYWRHFANKEWIGNDENGNMVSGKTWVKPHSRYKERQNHSNSQKVVYLKSRIPNRLQEGTSSPHQASTPLIEIDSNSQSSRKPEFLAESNKEEYLYVLVNPAHKQGLFKVGYTTRTPEERARELSSHTGNPTNYLVVESWRVKDGKETERIVHHRLEKYRLSGNREFFLVDYTTLRAIIDESISNGPN
jgi:hypothetical protein